MVQLRRFLKTTLSNGFRVGDCEDNEIRPRSVISTSLPVLERELDGFEVKASVFNSGDTGDVVALKKSKTVETLVLGSLFGLCIRRIWLSARAVVVCWICWKMFLCVCFGNQF
ncbi:hypothetical protein HanPSC8_Chr11g0493381 [Helianthus annuus]|nr:hypothetical protein HanPSC8_Chr11g0493381 [Helianthus annuus]